MDTQLAQVDQTMVTNPLEKFLRAYQFGTCNQTKQTNNYASLRVKDLWQEDVNSDSDHDENQEPGANEPMASGIPTEASAVPPPNEGPGKTNARPKRTRKKPQWLVTDT
jgi:hypothetical protein